MNDPNIYQDIKLKPLKKLSTIHPNIVHSELVAITPVDQRYRNPIKRITRITRLFMSNGNEVLMFENNVSTVSHVKNIAVFTSSMNSHILCLLANINIDLKQNKSGKKFIYSRLKGKAIPVERFNFKLTVQEILNQYEEENK